MDKLDKIDIFPKEDHEKKQLEEIAHLYFSTPAPPSKGPTQPESRERRFAAFSPFTRTLFVRCVAEQAERGLSTWFLFNLSVMLKILNGPVLLIGSEQVYEKRYLFGFRPDRERLKINDGPRIPSGNFGPMGVCLLDGRVLWKGLGDEGGSYPVDPMAGRQVAFRYILSDEVRSGVVCRSLPGLVVLLVTPSTTSSALLDCAMGSEHDLFPGPGHAGIVVANAGSVEEADALYLYWRDKIAERYDGKLAAENFGVLPSEIFPGPLDARLGWNETVPSEGPFADLGPFGVGVLEHPDSALTRFCRTTASLIRIKRSEMLHESS